jgi:hypothetical protein
MARLDDGGRKAGWAGRIGDLAWLLAPLLFAVPILYTIGDSLVHVVQLSHPYLGDTSGVEIDGQTVYLGIPLFQSPAAGYTPEPYTPLFPVLIGALDHALLWRGWGYLLGQLGIVALMLACARFAYSTRTGSWVDRGLSVLPAVGIGALAWWLVVFVPFNLVYAIRPDHLSWAFALIGLALVPAVAHGSRRAWVLALLLLSVGFWAKQTALLASVAAVAWLAIAAARGRASRRTATTFGAALLVLNGAAFAALVVATSGWASTFLLTMPGRHAQALGTLRSARELLEAVAVSAALAAWLWLVWFVRARRSSDDAPRPPARTIEIATVLALFVVLDAPVSIIFRQAQGAASNVFLGIAWALALLCAIAYGLDRAHPAGAVAAAVAVAALFGLSESTRAKKALEDVRVHVPAKSTRALAIEEAPALRAYARSHSVYHPVYADVNAEPSHQLYPTHDNFQALLAAGYQPKFLVRELLNRRFDAVFLLQDDRVRERAAGTGKWEDNYIWKLNQVMLAKYRVSSDIPAAVAAARSAPSALAPYVSPGVLALRDGPDPAPWLRFCFGPFDIAGAKWSIRRGGGFWCRPGGRGALLRLVATPADWSEVRANRAAQGTRGELAIAAAARGEWFEVAARGWRIRGDVDLSGRVRLVELNQGRPVGSAALTSVAGPRARLVLVLRAAGDGRLRTAGPGRAQVGVPLSAGGELSLRGSRRSGVEFDVGGLG